MVSFFNLFNLSILQFPVPCHLWGLRMRMRSRFWRNSSNGGCYRLQGARRWSWTYCWIDLCFSRLNYSVMYWYIAYVFYNLSISCFYISGAFLRRYKLELMYYWTLELDISQMWRTTASIKNPQVLIVW